MPSPGRPKMVSTPQAMRQSIRMSEPLRAMVVLRVTSWRISSLWLIADYRTPRAIGSRGTCGSATSAEHGVRLIRRAAPCMTYASNGQTRSGSRLKQPGSAP